MRLMKRIITVGEALPGKEIGTEDATVTDTGNETMIETVTQIMIGNVDVDEIGIGIGIERGTGTGIGTEIVTACEMKRIMVVIGSEIGSGKVGSRRGETGTVAGGGVTQEAEVGAGIGRIVRVGSTGRDMHAAAPVPEDGMELKKMALGKSLRRRERKEKKKDGTDHPDPEIAEANRLRASLGLKPLK